MIATCALSTMTVWSLGMEAGCAVPAMIFRLAAGWKRLNTMSEITKKQLQDLGYDEDAAWRKSCSIRGTDIREAELRLRLLAIVNDEAKDILRELRVVP